jgi:hypothetical protein
MLLPESSSGWDETNSFRGAVLQVGDTYVLSYTGGQYEMGIATQPVFSTAADIINNPEAVFDFYDDFAGTSLDSSKWAVTNGSASQAVEAGGTLTLTATSTSFVEITSVPTFGMNYIVEASAQHPQQGVLDMIAEVGLIDSDFGDIVRIVDDYPTSTATWNRQAKLSGQADSNWNAMAEAADQQWHIFSVYRLSSDVAGFQIDQNPVESVTSNVPASNLSAYLMSYTGGGKNQVVADWVRVRKFVSPQPVAALDPVNSITISPSIASISAGGSQSYTAQAFDQYGDGMADVTASTSFTISPDGSCTGASCTPSVAGAHTVTGTYSGMTATASLQVSTATTNPVPVTTSLSPSSATAGGLAFTLTINGSGFVNGSVVQWNGGNRATTYVSSTQVTAAILAADIASGGTAQVTVFSPAPGGGTSNAQTFTINNPAPTTTGLSPASATAGGAGFTLTVNGTVFVSGSVVSWDGSSRTTTYVSSTQLTAAIPAADIASAGTARVTVSSPAPGGGTSNAQTSTINNPVPATSGLSPAFAPVGGAGFTLTVNGTGFVAGSTVNWNGSSRTTTYVSSTQVTAAILATDIAVAGTAKVTVVNSAPSGGNSNSQTFTINNPVPATTGLSPASTAAEGAGFTLTVNGTGFVSGSTVNWNGSSRTTTYVSSTQVTAAILATDIAVAGTAKVTVVNLTPGGGTSNAQTFTINNAVLATTGLSPASATAGGAGFTLTVNGTGFVSGSAVNWNGSSRTTTYVSPTQVTAAILAADIAAGGTASVTVVNPAPGGGTSNAQTFTINNPVPATTGLSPASATAGGAGFTLTVNGTGFVSGSTVNWKGSSRTTTYVSPTQVTAAISAADIAAGGTAAVTVVNPTPGGGTSNAQTFTINNPVPTTTGLSPASAAAEGAGFTLTVNGTGFVSGSTVNWNGSSRTTTYVSPTQVTAAITAADIASTGTAAVTVVNPTPGGGTSNAQTFTINNAVLATTGLSPASATAGGAGFTLTVNGTGFVSGSTVNWNGSSRTTTYVSPTQVTAAILAADIASTGTASVTVVNPAPGGGTSNAQTFTINNPVPTTTGLSPASATAGGAGFTLTVNGTGFVSGSTVSWKGSSRTTTYVSLTQVTAAITAADIASGGTAAVTVVNPTPGGGTSNAQTFTINNPVPTTTGLSPASAIAGGAAFTLTVNGTGFVSGSTVHWKGSSVTTTYVSPTQVTAAITAADIASAGTAAVTVVNATPGGGTSNAQTFTITGLALDSSTPAAVKTNTQTLTTASFTPPAGSVLYICVMLNSNASPATDQNYVSQITDNLGTHLTYTLQKQYGTASGNSAIVYLYTAPVSTSQAMTVSITQGATDTSISNAMVQVLVITGANASSPVGKTAGAGATATNISGTDYNSSVNDSWSWLIYADWNANAVPTVPSGETVYNSYTNTMLTAAVIKNNSVTATAGTAVTIKTSTPTSGVDLAWLAFEIIP